MFRYTTDCGREVSFISEAAYEAAIDSYNNPQRTKREMTLDYSERMDDGAIYDDADCTVLTDEWADLYMAAWARDEFGRAEFVWR